jgi:sugar fermentation stimulation protein A
MKFDPPLEPAILHKRYKRFLADVSHPGRGEITVHCPNTGSMKNCWQPDWKVWLQDSQNPKRKYQYSWVLAENELGELIGVNTQLANQIAYEGVEAGLVKQLNDIRAIEKEVKYGDENSRIDLLIKHNDGSQTYVEVKSVTLKDPKGLAQAGKPNVNGCFPDAVTTRGQKHLRELMLCVEQGHKAMLLFMVQHTGINNVTAASHIDKDYAELLKQAAAKGVEIVAYAAKITPNKVVLDQPVEFIL